VVILTCRLKKGAKMICIANIISKIDVRFKHWMREVNWPLWLWMTDANSDCTPVILNRPIVFINSYIAFGFSNYLRAVFSA